MNGVAPKINFLCIWEWNNYQFFTVYEKVASKIHFVTQKFYSQQIIALTKSAKTDFINIFWNYDRWEICIQKRISWQCCHFRFLRENDFWQFLAKWENICIQQCHVFLDFKWSECAAKESVASNCCQLRIFAKSDAGQRWASIKHSNPMIWTLDGNLTLFNDLQSLNDRSEIFIKIEFCEKSTVSRFLQQNNELNPTILIFFWNRDTINLSRSKLYDVEIAFIAARFSN